MSCSVIHNLEMFLARHAEVAVRAGSPLVGGAFAARVCILLCQPRGSALPLGCSVR